jgi:hypothetical protein
MGVSQPAISQRAARKRRLPFVEHKGRRWFRRDHLERVKRGSSQAARAGELVGRAGGSR